MDTFDTGMHGDLSRAISAEVRARMAARRVSLRTFATEAGFKSHNYVAVRNRDEKPYDLDDLELICAYFDVDPFTFVQQAMARYRETMPAMTSDQRETLAKRLAEDVNDPEVDAARKVVAAQRKKRTR